MSDIIVAGKALYWGTSEWSADEIRVVCEYRGAAPPAPAGRRAAAVPPERTATVSSRSTAACTTTWGIGLTTWSPLAIGLWSGKYVDGVPDDSRAMLPGYEWLRDTLTDEARNQKVKALAGIADELGCTTPDTAIVWNDAQPACVSTVITGASRVEQVQDNLGVLEVLPHLADRES